MYAALVFTALAGGLVGLYLGGRLTGNIKLLLAFSGAYLLALTVMHILPELYTGTYPDLGLFILSGFILQILMDYFSKGIEHGHIHWEDQQQSRFPYSIFISLCLHSLIEGLPLSETGVHAHAGHSHGLHNGLLLGIIVHKIPEAIALAALLSFHFRKKLNAFLTLLLYAVMTPIGVVLGKSLYRFFPSDAEIVYHYTLAVVVGIFLHVSTTILFESSENHKFNYRKLLAVVLGFGLVYIATA